MSSEHSRRLMLNHPLIIGLLKPQGWSMSVGHFQNIFFISLGLVILEKKKKKSVFIFWIDDS